MCSKKTSTTKTKASTGAASMCTPEYEYDETSTVQVKQRDERVNSDLTHYFGPLLRDDKVIDHLHKYCSPCLESHIIKRYKNSTSTGNLRSHLSYKHGISLQHKLTERNQRLVTDMLVKVGNEDSNLKPTMSDGRFILARQLCLWFCRDLLSFNTANKDGLHDFCVYAGLIKPVEKLPDRTTISDTALNDIYDVLKAYIKKFLQSNLPQTITTSMDFWSDNVKRISYINYWIFWINDDWEMQNLCLGLKRFPHPHTGELLAEAFNKIKEEFNLLLKTILAVTDSGGNVKLGCRILGLEREACLCHNLHLLVAVDLIKNHPELKPIRDLIRRLKEVKKTLIYKFEDLKKISDLDYNKRLHHLISSFQNISKILECTEVLISEFDEDDDDSQLLADFCNKQNRNDTTFTTIKNSNATRWNSVKTMFNSFIKNCDTVNNCSASIKRYDLILSDTELTLAMDFVKILEIFEKATDVMQGDSYPTLNLAVFYYVDIKASLKALVDCKTSSSIIQISASFLLERLDDRFPLTENMIVAAFLDPSMQNLPLISSYCRANEVDMVELLVKKWTDYEPKLPQLQEQSLVPMPIPNKPGKASQIKRDFIQKHIDKENFTSNSSVHQIHNEYLKYTSVSNLVENPLLWWKSNERTFPYLGALAKVMLSIPCSSSAPEHHFSETGYYVNKKKANVDPLTVEKVMFIHDNFQYISCSN